MNGKPFEFDEELPKDPTERLTRGVVELDFVTTRLSHEARYQFNLRDPVQRAKATKMLERVYVRSFVRSFVSCSLFESVSYTHLTLPTKRIV